MKLKEVILKLSALQELGHGEDELVIEISNNLMGGVPTTKIEYINSGFDWNRGQIIFTPKEKVYIKTGKKSND